MIDLESDTIPAGKALDAHDHYFTVKLDIVAFGEAIDRNCQDAVEVIAGQN